MAKSKRDTLAVELEHYCDDPDGFPINKFLQLGEGIGRDVLVVGEAPARDGWRISGKAFYNLEGKLIPTGKYLNELLDEFGLRIETCSFTDLVKCYVGQDRRLLKECGRKCWPIFVKQVRGMEFKLIIILGANTLEVWNDAAQTELRIGELSTCNLGGVDCYVLPIYHTSPQYPFGRTKNRGIVQRWHDDVERILSS